jgi:hypothetical protein
MKQENNILINIIGTGYDICVGEVSASIGELFQRISKERKLSLHAFFLMKNFIKKIKLKNPLVCSAIEVSRRPQSYVHVFWY